MADANSNTLGAYIAAKTDPVKDLRDKYALASKAVEKRQQRWRDIYAAYQGWIDPSKKLKGHSNLHYHTIFPQIETALARYMISYFTHDPFVTVRPNNQASVDAAKNREDLLQHYFNLCPNHFIEKARFTKYTLLFGSAISVPLWKQIRGNVVRTVPVTLMGREIDSYRIQEEAVVYDGFWFNTYAPNQVYPFPDAKSMQTMPWMIIEEWVHCSELLEMAEDGMHYDKAAVMRVPLNQSGQGTESYRQYQASIGQPTAEGNPEMIRLQHLFAPKYIRTLANDAEMIRDVPNFFWHQKLNAVQGVQTIDPDSFWPLGSAHMLMANQKIMNMLINSVVDHLNYSRFWRFKYKREVGIKPHLLMQSTTYPIDVKSMDDVDIINPPELKQDIAWFKDVIERSNEYISGYYGTQRGASEARQTATSDTIFQSEGNKRIQSDVMTFEQLGLLHEAKLLSSHIDQFMPQSVEVRMAGDDGWQFKRQTQADIQGEFDFYVGGISEQLNLSVFQQQMTNMYAQLRDAQQFIQMPDGRVLPVPLIDAYNIVKSMLEPTLGKGAGKVLLAPSVFGGQRLNNDMLAKAGMPMIPQLDNMAPGGPEFGGGPLPASGNPVDIINSSVKPRVKRVA